MRGSGRLAGGDDSHNPALRTPAGAPQDEAGASGDEARRRGLRRMRQVAVGLLLLAAIVYVGTLDRGGPWPYVHATAEAAMVGAIADWFAVTALFRHPLGIPIPHTALIPRRKQALGVSLQEFVTDNFLVEHVVRDRVTAAGIAGRVGSWLADPAHRTRVVDEGARLARLGLDRIGDDDVAALVEHELVPRLLDEPLSPLVGNLLAEVVRDGAHHGLVDLVVVEVHRWLLVNEETVAAVVGTRAPWWSPGWLDQQVGQRVHTELLGWVTDVRDDPRHEARQALDALLGRLANDLQHDPDTMDAAEQLKRRVLGQPRVVTTATALWNAVRRALVTSLADPDSAVRARAHVQLAALAERLRDDAELRTRLDGYAADLAAFVVTTYGNEITTVITETVDRWDGDEAARRIELHVGRDLQFIRINGTLVGGLAGLVIHTLTQLV
ncbi:MAG: DUF445 domain-containing protein [Nocardioidaceae bacterium]|nr:DUF445 domain-containing protein [Nocardioidaceae bacterium]